MNTMNSSTIQPTDDVWMQNDAIKTAQTSVHEDLNEVVARHAAHPFLKPILAHNQRAFDTMMQAWAQRGFAPLIIDAGCGVGESTLHIARDHPECFVVGIDQSQVRIQTHKTWWHDAMPENFIWLRADLIDFWRLLHAQLEARGTKLHKHFILYPNPYPKIGQLHKRWHGHSVFPHIVALGGQLEVRSNWGVYVSEFAQAVAQISQRQPARIGQMQDVSAITPFERKYQLRNEPLFACVFDLGSCAYKPIS
jgi:tRNA (guanine-N7-)-methyltransferase